LIFLNNSSGATFDENGNFISGSILEYCEILGSGSIGIYPVNIYAIAAFGHAPFLNNVVIKKGTWGIKLDSILGEFRAVNVTIDSMYTPNGAKNVDIINCMQASMIFQDSYFASGDYAFAIYGINLNANLEIVDSIMTDHKKDSFAAIWISSSDVNLKMKGCQLYGNVMAIGNEETDLYWVRLDLTNCTFYDNEDAVKLSQVDTLAIKNCTFRATEQLYISNCQNLTISNSVFEDSGMIIHIPLLN
jgi:hypothetical protein